MAASGLVAADGVGRVPPGGASTGGGRAAANDAGAALHQLIDAEWDYRMEHSPTWASSLGDRRWNDRWDDLSLDAIYKNHQHELDLLERLKPIDRGRLSPHDQLNYDLFRKDYDTDLEEYPFQWYLVPLNQRDGVHTW